VSGSAGASPFADGSGRREPPAPELAGLRQNYDSGRLDDADVAPTWIEQFTRWFADAQSDQAVVEPNAMALATASAAGHASVRTVLAKDISARGVVFYTHYDSPKGLELAETRWASVVFAWLAHQRQVRLSGPTEPVERAETQRYFSQRPRGSQLGAWASEQSSVVANRAELDAAEAAMERRFAGSDDIPPPPRWGGYLLRPTTVEFWQGRQNRMHDRLRFRREDVAAERWQLDRLAP
jgi:pyridoxamine 5'-phosphate oxidase